MFMDELKRIDDMLNSPATRSRLRRTAYSEFRDRTERMDRIGHVAPRRRRRPAIAPWPAMVEPRPSRRWKPALEPEPAAALPEPEPAAALPEVPRHVVPVLRFVRESQRAFRGDFLKWTCVECGRFLFMWADSSDPDKCPDCGNTMEGRPWKARA